MKILNDLSLRVAFPAYAGPNLRNFQPTTQGKGNGYPALSRIRNPHVVIRPTSPFSGKVTLLDRRHLMSYEELQKHLRDPGQTLLNGLYLRQNITMVETRHVIVENEDEIQTFGAVLGFKGKWEPAVFNYNENGEGKGRCPHILAFRTPKKHQLRSPAKKKSLTKK